MIDKPEFTGVNEDFEIIFNAAGAENMNLAKVPWCVNDCFDSWQGPPGQPPD